MAGFEESFVSPANEIKTRWGDSKNEIDFDVHLPNWKTTFQNWKTRPNMVEKWQNLRNEIKTRSEYSLRFDCLTPPGAASAPKRHGDEEAAMIGRFLDFQNLNYETRD